MTQSETKLIMEIEFLLYDFVNNIEKIASLLKGQIINTTLGTQLIYSDTTRNHRMLMFIIMLNESSNLKTDWVTAYHLLKEAYIMTDNIYAQLQKSPYPFDLTDYLLEMKQHVNTDELMQPEELAFLNNLQFPLTVYRGMCNKEFEDGQFGVSWSDKVETASRYVFYSKNNNTEKDGKIVSFKIDRSDIFAAWGVVGMDKELIVPGLQFRMDMASKNDENFIAFCDELRAYVEEHRLFPDKHTRLRHKVKYTRKILRLGSGTAK